MTVRCTLNPIRSYDENEENTPQKPSKILTIRYLSAISKLVLKANPIIPNKNNKRPATKENIFGLRSLFIGIYLVSFS